MYACVPAAASSQVAQPVPPLSRLSTAPAAQLGPPWPIVASPRSNSVVLPIEIVHLCRPVRPLWQLALPPPASVLTSRFLTVFSPPPAMCSTHSKLGKDVQAAAWHTSSKAAVTTVAPTRSQGSPTLSSSCPCLQPARRLRRLGPKRLQTQRLVLLPRPLTPLSAMRLLLLLSPQPPQPL